MTLPVALGQVPCAPSVAVDLPTTFDTDSNLDRPLDSISRTPTSSSSSESHFEAANQVLLRVEYLSDGEAKGLIVALRLTMLAGLASLIYLFVAKLKMANSYYFQHDMLQVWNVTAASACLAALLATLAMYGWRVWLVHRAGKQWTHRRRKQACLCLCELVVQMVNLVFYLVPNVYTLLHACAWYHPIVHVSGLLRWTCWNTLFFLATVQGHNVNSLANPSMRAKSTNIHAEAVQHLIVMDARWRYHANKLPLWFAIEGVLIAFGWWLLTPSHRPGTCPIGPHEDSTGQKCYVQSIPPGTEDNCRLWEYACTRGAAIYTFTALLTGLVALYFLMYTFFIFSALRQLSMVPYAAFRVANFAVRLQLHIRMMAFAFMMVSCMLLWFAKIASCTSYLEIWLGMFPMQLSMTGLAIWVAFLATPKTPNKDASLLVWLQEYAITEAEKPARLARRGLPNEPMFCFETALKLQYWAGLVYGYQAGVLGGKRDENLSLGMRLYELEHSEMVWEKRGDTNVLIAWGPDTIVISFRGTASLANVITDLQVWRATYPAAQPRVCLGAQPMVHKGFLASWQANGLDQRVLQCVTNIVSQRKACAPTCQVYITGHSLGGALATLAAFDIQQQLQGQHSLQVCCYAYGAPRTGNHAFARLYNKVVPDTWHVINGQDAVAHEGKFLVLYKRPGHRVIINQRGDLIVRPTLVEHSVRRVPGGSSINQHLLSSYRKSLLTVINAQFTQKGGHGGQRGVLKLAEGAHMRQLLEECLGVDLLSLSSLKPRVSMFLPDLEDPAAPGSD
ncbi:hypothetical protein WJX72_012370 [[Myrmecia] bisecta]|uniref:Fungal lipase-type domain-containing protein n=1 Tax=[Myrmecia] bisecta TaxID=41462 RepID=A0AAW1QA91_9CHLO